MNHYSFVGLYKDEQINLNQDDSIKIDIPLFTDNSKLDHNIGTFINKLSQKGLVPNDLGLDLVILALLVYAADTRVSRDEFAQDGWTREFDIYIPVLNINLWENNKKLIQQILNFLSGDQWNLFFRQRPVEFINILNKETTQKSLFSYSCISLLSGGLDSYTGAIDILNRGEKPIFISHHCDPANPVYQTACVTSLENKYGLNSFFSLSTSVGFDKKIDSLPNRETTLRSRSFLFFALAILTATCFENSINILVPENGLISLNVPLDSLRLGALSTRTTHPFYMAKWNELLSSLNFNTQLINPYRFRTKGEMLAECSDKDFLKETVNLTISCSSPKLGGWKSDLKHCGYCLPCIIRRASIEHAFLTDFTEYRCNIKSKKILNSKRAEGEDVRSFQYAINKIKKNPRSARFSVHIPGPLTDYSLDDINKYEQVYTRGMNEVAQLLKDVKTKPR